MSVFNAWFLFVVASMLGCAIGALIWDVLRADKRRFTQRDWVAEQKRRISHRAFKSRMGAR